MGNACAGRAQADHLGIVDVNPMGQPDVVAHPTPLVEHLHWPTAEPFDAVVLFINRLAQVGVQTQAVPPGQLGGLHHEFGGHREGAARCDGHLHHVAVVVAGDHRLSGGQDVVSVLHHVVRWQATLALPEVHGPT